MATVPAYGLMWGKGIDDLLVVSVGTGARAATAQRSRPNPVSALSSLTRLPSVFMNGSAFSQDLLCRAIGDCRYGPLLDSEIGALLGQQLLNDNDVVPSPGRSTTTTRTPRSSASTSRSCATTQTCQAGVSGRSASSEALAGRAADRQCQSDRELAADRQHASRRDTHHPMRNRCRVDSDRSSMLVPRASHPLRLA